jgi:hypothetical protein
MTVWFLEIERKRDGYQGRLHPGDPDPGRALVEMALGPDAEIEIKGRSYPLGRLVEGLIAFQPSVIDDILDERGQWELGRYLYRETLGRSGRDLPAEADIHLRVQTEDEHILRLPWTLIARDATFLSMTGWSVAFGGTGKGRECELPPSPHVLVVISQPQGLPDTQAGAHVTELEERLSLVDPRFRRGSHLHVVHTWDEFLKSVKERHHEIFYYYGHGVGDVAHSRLCFARGDERDDRPMADVAHALREAAGGPPLLAYVNCCQGDAGGWLGAGRQLLGLVPAVVSNRTVAYIDAARKQALEFWQATLVEGKPPHEAIARMYSAVGDMGLSLKHTRWMTPVLHCDYRR